MYTGPQGEQGGDRKFGGYRRCFSVETNRPVREVGAPIVDARQRRPQEQSENFELPALVILALPWND
jgi:hypothetical protein